MNHHDDFIEEIQQEVIKQVISYDDIDTLNNESNRNDNVIMYTNIRSLNSNFEKLQILI